jgi:hypothetical protein
LQRREVAPTPLHVWLLPDKKEIHKVNYHFKLQSWIKSFQLNTDLKHTHLTRYSLYVGELFLFHIFAGYSLMDALQYKKEKE